MRRTVGLVSVAALAMILTGCGSSGGAVRASGSGGASSPTTANTMTTMSSPATADAGATIEVRAQSGLTAAIAGTVERSTTVVDGVAVFAGLSEGTYRVVLTDESTPVPDRAGVGIRGALQIFNGGTYELHAGDHAVVTCDASTCSGVLGR